MKNRKVSVVVPIYNIEKYVGRCVESILKQTYSDIEVILVLDGSTDGSANICKKFSDDRIVILEKENGGLSDARNYGLRYAKGEYIMFIDGDDFVDEKLVETLLLNIERTGADISVCSYVNYYDNGETRECYKHENKNNIEIYNRKQAILKIIDRNIAFRQCAWNKMYKRELFRDVLYPVGKLYEDLGTTYKLVLRANKIVYSHQNLYYYVQRANSITKTHIFSDREYDRIEQADIFCNEVTKRYPEYKYQFMRFQIMQYLAVINIMISDGGYDRKLVHITKKMIKDNYSKIKKYAGAKEKYQMILFSMNYPLYKAVYKNRKGGH